MILITGATGAVGSRLVRELAERDAGGNLRVRALARTDASAEKLAGAGVEAVRGDLDDPTSLREAFEGVARLFLLTPFGASQARQEHNALDAAGRAGVRRVVKLSVSGADLDIAVSRAHKEVEGRLAIGSGFEVTVLRPDSYATNLLGQLPYIAAGQIVFPARDVRLAFVDPRDIAAAAAEALTRDEPLGGTYTLTGPERLDFAEVARRVSAAVGLEVRYVDAPPDSWRDGLVSVGVPVLLADGLVETFDALASNGGNVTTDAVRLILGRPPRPLDEFLREELAPALAAQDTA